MNFRSREMYGYFFHLQCSVCKGAYDVQRNLLQTLSWMRQEVVTEMNVTITVLWTAAL
jgi:hypothetical protein